MGIAIHGFIEKREGGEWVAVREVDFKDFPRCSTADELFGFRDSSPREDRGIPEDASEEVKDAYEQQKTPIPGSDGYHRHEFGHTYVTRDEVPEGCRDYASVLWEIDARDEDVRVVAWASN